MKPNFALSLSSDGITLLHRAAGGWREVGEVSISADDLAGELAMLRKTAASLEPGGVRTKLVIPASQIKYLTVDTMGLSEAACRKAAEAALRGATPYDVSDLVYDISLDGAKTHVAAVARETLAEAEAFATEHRFHPVSFVAVPGDALYLGEPFFGMAEGAAALLEPGETVQPDGISVVVVGSVVSEPTALSPVPAPQPAAPAPAQAAANPVQQPAPTPTPAPPTVAAPRVDPLNATPPRAAQQPAPTRPVAQPASAPAVINGLSTNAAPPAAPSATKAQPTPRAPSITQAPSIAQAPSTPAPKPDAPPIGAAPSVESPSGPAVPPQSYAPVTPVPPKPALQTGAAAPAPLEPTKPTLSAATKVYGAATPALKSTTSFSSRRNAPLSAEGKPFGGAQRIALGAPKPDSSSLLKPAPVADKSEAAPAKQGFLSRRKAAVSAIVPRTAPAPAMRMQPAGTEAERMTVFGARPDQVGGKPRFLGLIMTVVLLVFLAGVAAWAAVFLDDGLAGLLRKDPTRATASAPENQIDPEIIRTPDGQASGSPPAADAVQTAALDPVLSTQDTGMVDAMQNPRPEPERPVITEQEAAARYAVTGIWPLPPATPLTQPEAPVEEVYHSTVDPVSAATDAIALPAATGFETDVLLAAVVSPPPFGQRTDVSAGGLIMPTPEGVVAPGGYTLVAASPPRKPPAAINRGVVPPAATDAVVVTTAVAVSPLLDFRPKNRPSGLAEQTERTLLGGVSRVELAAFRPSLRPASLQDRAADAEAAAAAQATAEIEARAAASAATATAAAAAALAVPQPAIAAVAPTVQNATRLAATQSRRPDTRPRNFARIVKRAEREAPAAEAQETQVAAAATTAPRSVAPSIPSKTSVARSATVKNAINLRQVNLIGVYGKPSSRRALIRLSNGRYQKVSVGDRIDGGRVSAIGNSELRYTKGGRNVVLKMP